MARRGQGLVRSNDDVNINDSLTPMLDVVFIMLIFFIVTATFIKQAGIDVLRPDALTAEQKPTVLFSLQSDLLGKYGSIKSVLILTQCAHISKDYTPKTPKAAW